MNKSPIQKLNNKINENEIYVKREDLLTFSLGGNKVRIAQEFFEDMERKGLDTMVAYGNTRSNLCRVIANTCSMRHIPCYIICSREEHEEVHKETGNSHLMKLLGAKLVPCEKKEIAQTVECLMDEIREKGGKPYYIYGNKFGTGNEGTAVRAYAKAYQEILEYEKEAGITFDYVFHASGTGATQGGLTCGHILSQDQKKIVGILISSREYERAFHIIKEGMQSYFHEHKIEWTEDYEKEIILAGEYTKGGYGIYDKEILEIVRNAFVSESLPLDPTYTGKAFWGMQQYIKDNKLKNKKILFIHTGGSPLFYDCLQEGVLG